MSRPFVLFHCLKHAPRATRRSSSSSSEIAGRWRGDVSAGPPGGVKSARALAAPRPRPVARAGGAWRWGRTRSRRRALRSAPARIGATPRPSRDQVTRRGRACGVMARIALARTRVRSGTNRTRTRRVRNEVTRRAQDAAPARAGARIVTTRPCAGRGLSGAMRRGQAHDAARGAARGGSTCRLACRRSTT